MGLIMHNLTQELSNRFRYLPFSRNNQLPPGQPQLIDRRTGERADLLFTFRTRGVSTA